MTAQHEMYIAVLLSFIVPVLINSLYINHYLYHKLPRRQFARNVCTAVSKNEEYCTKLFILSLLACICCALQFTLKFYPQRTLYAALSIVSTNIALSISFYNRSLIPCTALNALSLSTLYVIFPLNVVLINLPCIVFCIAVLYNSSILQIKILSAINNKQ